MSSAKCASKEFLKLTLHHTTYCSNRWREQQIRIPHPLNSVFIQHAIYCGFFRLAMEAGTLLYAIYVHYFMLFRYTIVCYLRNHCTRFTYTILCYLRNHCTRFTYTIVRYLLRTPLYDISLHTPLYAISLRTSL